LLNVDHDLFRVKFYSLLQKSPVIAIFAHPACDITCMSYACMTTVQRQRYD